VSAENTIVGEAGRSSGDAWLWERARLTPHAAALHFGSSTDARAASDAPCDFDYAALAREAETIALRLVSLGIARGDRIAVRTPNHPRLVALLHAAQKIGAVLVPVNTRLGGAELGPLLAHAEPRLVLLDSILTLQSGAGSAALYDPGRLSQQVPNSAVPGTCYLDVHRDLDRVTIAKSAALPPRIDATAAWMIVYTSGTTALPKGVVLTNANHCAAAAASRQRLGHGGADVWLATLPLYHVGGLAILARAVLEGSRVDLEDGFDEARVRDAIESGPATMISLVPTMLARLLESPLQPHNAGLRCLLVGGAALSPALARQALELGLPIAATYGLSEACSQLCTTAPGSVDAADGSVGRPLPGVEVRIDEAGDDGVGELIARGANLTCGYFRNDDADAAAFDIDTAAHISSGDSQQGAPLPSEQRWLHTGDLARIDRSGRVHIAGRRSDLIVSGGENVVPAEVEALLEEHPAVRECVVFGLDDREWGQLVVALIALRRGLMPATGDDLRAWCRARLAAYKTPRLFRFVDVLPRNAGGKVDRRALAGAWKEAAS